MPLALDGTFSGSTTSGTFSCASGDVVMAFIFTDNVPTSVSDNSGASSGWTKRTSVAYSTFQVSLWYTTTTGTWSSVTITPTVSSGNIYGVQGCGISGANTSSPFDSNVSIPKAAGNVASTTFSTTSANTFVFAGGSSTATLFTDTGDGYTNLNPYANFTITMYQIFTSAQSGSTVNMGATAGIIIDAIVPASGAPILMAQIMM